jgi:hypothetical protein
MIIDPTTNLDFDQQALVKSLSQKINKDWQDNIRRELTDTAAMEMRREEKKLHFEANQKLPGLTKDKTMRKVAEVPFYIWKAMKNIFGEDYWRKKENLRRHPEFWVVDNYK